MDFLTQKEIEEWLAKVKYPAVADVGFGQIHGSRTMMAYRFRVCLQPIHGSSMHRKRKAMFSGRCTIHS